MVLRTTTEMEGFPALSIWHAHIEAPHPDLDPDPVQRAYQHTSQVASTRTAGLGERRHHFIAWDMQRIQGRTARV